MLVRDTALTKRSRTSPPRKLSNQNYEVGTVTAARRVSKKRRASSQALAHLTLLRQSSRNLIDQRSSHTAMESLTEQANLALLPQILAIRSIIGAATTPTRTDRTSQMASSTSWF